jgi:hypothetical protein
MKVLKRNFLLLIPLAIISFEIYLGVTIGYITARILSGKETGKKGIVKSLVFDVGKYRIHLHHWILGASMIPIAIYYNITFFSDKLIMGILGGLSYQGIISYKDWYKILFRKK